jgi:ribosomal protein L37E
MTKENRYQLNRCHECGGHNINKHSLRCKACGGDSEKRIIKAKKKRDKGASFIPRVKQKERLRSGLDPNIGFND